MKRALITLAAAASCALGVAAPTHAAPAISPHIAFPGETVRYFFSSDSPTGNTIRYYGASGGIVTRHNVRFEPTLINIGGPPRWHLAFQFTSPGRQLVGSQHVSPKHSAQCKVYVAGSTVDSDYQPRRGIATC